MTSILKKIWLPLLFVVLAVAAVDRLLMPLYTSSGKDLAVPDVRNRPFEDAAGILEKAGFEAKRSYNVRYLPNVGAEMVIDQTPSAGSKVKPGRSVYLVLNRRDKPGYTLPELTGRPEQEARQAIERIGMSVESVQYRSVSNPDQEGKVLSQSIPPGVTVTMGTAVSLIVGKYEEETQEKMRIVVPEVLGMSFDQAKSTLLQSGLTVGQITYEQSTVLVPNTVISQKPAVNSFVPAGQPIEMTVVTEN